MAIIGVNSTESSAIIAYNVLQLGEVADLEALTFNLELMFIRKPNIQFRTEPAILPNCCYVPYFWLSLKYFSISVIALSSPFSFLICCPTVETFFSISFV